VSLEKRNTLRAVWENDGRYIHSLISKLANTSIDFNQLKLLVKGNVLNFLTAEDKIASSLIKFRLNRPRVEYEVSK
jgi:hypothetical protein